LVSIETNSSGIRPIEFQPYQFLLTLHPNENLDPRTHFLLATHASKNATVLLTEICAKYRLGALSYNEISEVGPRLFFILLIKVFPLPPPVTLLNMRKIITLEKLYVLILSKVKGLFFRVLIVFLFHLEKRFRLLV